MNHKIFATLFLIGSLCVTSKMVAQCYELSELEVTCGDHCGYQEQSYCSPVSYPEGYAYCAITGYGNCCGTEFYESSANWPCTGAFHRPKAKNGTPKHAVLESLLYVPNNCSGGYSLIEPSGSGYATSSDSERFVVLKRNDVGVHP
jgi:hypothetical protein